MGNIIIKVEHAVKEFKETTALKDVSVNFESGKIYGLVGRNGSGKTVLIKSICGFLPLTSGTVTVDGKVIGKDTEMPEDIGIIIEEPGFLPIYGGLQNLKFLSTLKGKVKKEALEQVLVTVGLDPYSKKKVGKYSMGMRQRLGIAQAIMENPHILILDEPMNGLDENGVREIRKLLLNLKSRERVIIIVSHNAENINSLCDEVYEMDGGVLTIRERT